MPPSRFRVLRPLGAGSMARVELAEDTLLDRPVALKHPHAELWARPQARERFLREAKAMAALSHPHILQLYDIGEGEAGAEPFLAFEYVDGPSLESWLERSGPLPNRVVLELARQLFSALAEAHARGVVHRDIKPGNILVTRQGAAKLADFGLSRREGSDGLTREGAFLGTPRYAPPELVKGEPLTAAADVYSLGAVLWECLAGKPAFSAADPQATLYRIAHEPAPPVTDARPDALPFLADLCGSCMRADPASRPGAKEVGETLTAFCEAEGWRSLSALIPAALANEVDDQGLASAEARALAPHWEKWAREAEARGRKAAASKYRHFATKGRTEPFSPEDPPKPPIVTGKDPLFTGNRRWLTPVLLALALAGIWGVRQALTRKASVPPPTPSEARPDSLKPSQADSRMNSRMDSLRASPAAATHVNSDKDRSPAASDAEAGPQSPSERNSPGDAPQPATSARTPAVQKPLGPRNPDTTIPGTDPASNRIPAANKNPGWLTVITRPPLAQILIDGTPAGRTPLTQPLRLPPGEHRVRLVREDCHPADTVLRIEAGRTFEWRRALDPK